MTRKTAANDQQLEMTFFEVPARPGDEIGSLDVSRRLRETLSDVLADAKARSGGELDRFEISTRISRLSGRDLSKNMLDRYSALSTEEWRLPTEILPALIKVTGDFRLLKRCPRA